MHSLYWNVLHTFRFLPEILNAIFEKKRIKFILVVIVIDFNGGFNEISMIQQKIRTSGIIR